VRVGLARDPYQVWTSKLSLAVEIGQELATIANLTEEIEDRFLPAPASSSLATRSASLKRPAPILKESYGYLGATFVRDKDAVMAAVLLADAVAYQKAHGRTLHDALQASWAKCGCFQEYLHNITLPGQEG
jgi:hypothetical protein